MLKPIESQEYLNQTREWIEAGKEVRLMISGSSMSPFLIHHRDSICCVKPFRDLRKGDMVFYQRNTDQYVMHRICDIKNGEYYLIGDAQTEIEGPLQREQIFALITKVQRKGKWIGPKDFLWRFFAYIWPRIIPLRKLFIKAYSSF